MKQCPLVRPANLLQDSASARQAWITGGPTWVLRNSHWYRSFVCSSISPAGTVCSTLRQAFSGSPGWPGTRSVAQAGLEFHRPLPPECWVTAARPSQMLERKPTPAERTSSLLGRLRNCQCSVLGILSSSVPALSSESARPGTKVPAVLKCPLLGLG